MLRSRRLAFAAAAVLVGLTACGSANSSTTATKSPMVIHVGAASDAAGGKAESPAADRMMMMQDVTFVYDGAFPDLGDTAQAWSLPAGTAPDLARVKKIAALLGAEGDIRELSADQGGGWMIGAADYSTATLTVSTDGMSSWWFNPAPTVDGSATGVGCAAPDSVGGGSSGVDPAAPADSVVDEPRPCEAPAPPSNVPTKDQALAAATSLFTDMGYDTSSYDFDTYADEWSANVTAYLLLDGHRSPITMSVGFGAEGAISWASGNLATPVAVDGYPLVSGDEAVQRLNDDSGRWSWFGGSPGVMFAADSGVSTGAPEPANEAAESVAPVPPDTAFVDPTPISQPVCDTTTKCIAEPGVPPEPITVHLNSMRLDVTSVWAEDGSIWLLPAYTFGSTDGGEYTMVAVDASYLDVPEPAPVDTTPVDTTPIATMPPVDTVVGDPAVDPTGTGPDVATAESTLVGLRLDEGIKVAESNAWTVRVSTLDGVSQILTADFQTNRVNVAVQDSMIVGVDSVG